MVTLKRAGLSVKRLCELADADGCLGGDALVLGCLVDDLMDWDSFVGDGRLDNL